MYKSHPILKMLTNGPNSVLMRFLFSILRRPRKHKIFVIPVFAVAKTISINDIVSKLLKTKEDNVVDPDFVRRLITNLIPLNIYQARAVYLSGGYLDNAKVALNLARQTPEGKMSNCIRSGLSSAPADRDALHFHTSFPLEWINLYQTWNMAFVTNFYEWSYIIVKLLIPQVSEYQNDPCSYMYSRLLGVYIHLNWFWMGYYVSGNNTLNHDMDWCSPSPRARSRA